MEPVLNDLIANLRGTLTALNQDGPAKSELHNLLHHPGGLPDKKLTALAAEAEHLLDSIQQLLQPPVELLADTLLGYLDTKCLVSAVSLGIPDILTTGPKTLPELAAASGAKPDRLQQHLRLLYNKGIFCFSALTGQYTNSPTSSLLTKAHWGQWHRWVDLYGNEFYDMARGIPGAVKDGETKTAAQLNWRTEKGVFDYANDNGWLPKLIGTIGCAAVAQAPGIVEDYPWREVADKTVLDVGGGSGDFIVSLLRKHQGMRGAILDTENVIKFVTPAFREPGGKFADVGGRMVQLVAGDFLVGVPSAEVYTMKWCLHDWTDEHALTVLRNARRAIREGPQSRFVIIEAVLEEGKKGRLARLGDITMMLAANGRERTLAEWERLAEGSGWKLTGVWALRGAWPSAIELRPA